MLRVANETSGPTGTVRCLFVTSPLVRLLMSIDPLAEVECGESDEGDPWWALVSPMTGETHAHMCQVDGVWTLTTATGRRTACNVATLLRDFRMDVPVTPPSCIAARLHQAKAG